MQDKMLWFPRLRELAGAGLLALGLVVVISTPTFAKGAMLNSGQSPLLAVDQLPVSATATATTVDATIGVVIIAIDAEGPAAQAGIVRGDILLKVGDAPVDSAAALYEVVKAAAPGDEVILSVQHGDDTRTIPVILGSVASDQVGERPYLGVQVADPTEVTVPGTVEKIVTATEVISDEIRTVAPGLFVAEVMADGPAAQAGLVAGDLIVAIDGQSIVSSDDFVNALKGYTPGDVVTLTVQKGTVQEGGSVNVVIADLPVTLGAAPDDPSRAYLGIRIVAEVPAVTVERSPATDLFSAPAIPVPSLPALPEMAPGFSYSYPGANAGDVCGTPNIQQYFYPPASVAPFVAPYPPSGPAHPAAPTVPYYIFHSEDNAEVGAYTVSGQVGQEVIVWQAQPATPGVEMQRFEIQLSPEAVQMVPTQQPGGDISVWVNKQVQGTDGAQTLEVFAYPMQFTQPHLGKHLIVTAPYASTLDITENVTEQDVVVQDVIKQADTVQKDVMIGQPQAQRQIMRSVPVEAIEEWY